MIGVLKTINGFSRLNLHCRHIVECSPFLPTSFQRNFTGRTRQVDPRVVAKLRRKDGIPNNYEIIYRAPMNILTQLALHTTTVTIMGTLGVGAYLYCTNTPSPLTGYHEQMSCTPNELIIYVTALVTMNLVLRYVCLQYILRIYHNPQNDMYRAILLGQLPMQTKSISFSKKSVDKLPKRRFVYSWSLFRYYLNGKKVILLEHCFRTSADMEKLVKQTTYPDIS